MAGSYPDPPNNRFAYDIDGSYPFVYYYGNDQTSNFSSTEIANLNSEKAVNGAITVSFGPIDPGSDFVGVIFPEPRTVTHIMSADTYGGEIVMPGNNRYIQYSTNATAPTNGTWTDISGQVTQHTLPLTGTMIRNGISVLTPSLSGVTGIRVYSYNYNLSGGSRKHSLHIYGDRPTNMDRLALWQSTENLEANGSTFDFGNVNRSGTYDKTFRVKNCSSSKTANGITLSANANGDFTPTFVSQTQFSYNGGAFGSTANVGNLAPGAISQTCTMRMALSSTASITSTSLRIIAQASSWT